MMEIRLEVISKAEHSELREEALEVPFLWHGVPLIFSMACGKTIDIVFGSDKAAEPVPPQIILAGAMSAFRERVYKALMNVPRGPTQKKRVFHGRIRNSTAMHRLWPTSEKKAILSIRNFEKAVSIVRVGRLIFCGRH